MKKKTLYLGGQLKSDYLKREFCGDIVALDVIDIMKWGTENPIPKNLFLGIDYLNKYGRLQKQELFAYAQKYPLRGV